MRWNHFQVALNLGHGSSSVMLYIRLNVALLNVKVDAKRKFERIILPRGCHRLNFINCVLLNAHTCLMYAARIRVAVLQEHCVVSCL